MLPGSDLCALRHRAFNVLPGVTFRRAADGVAVMTVPLGETLACVTLPSLKREFAIGDDSDDGRMLALIAEALDFVGSLRPGDRLPAEVLHGGASWTAGSHYHAIAAARLQRQLVSWLASMGGTVEHLDEGDGVRAKLQAALDAAATALNLPSASAVLDLIEALAEELAYIEALRDVLLRRVRSMVKKVNQMSLRRARDPVHQETMTQVQRLSDIALRQLNDRFAELDARSAEVLTALRPIDAERTFIRSTRDWLYRTSRAWAPILDEWARVGLVQDEFAWGLLSRTYQFLAPRYMPVTDWQSASRRFTVQPTAMPW